MICLPLIHGKSSLSPRSPAEVREFPVTRTRKAMPEPEQDVVTNLPRPEPAIRQQAGSAPGTTVFGVRNVSIWYSSFQAVTDVSMEIYEHEITAFIGSSGSG